MNVYIPNKHQVYFLNGLMWKIKTVQQGSLLVCGNFNITLEAERDSMLLTSKRTPFLLSFLCLHDLYDTQVNEKEFTFFSQLICYTRIDWLLMDKWLLQKIIQTKINNITWSDHASILLTLGDAYPKTATVVLRSNSQLVQNPSTKRVLENHLSKYYALTFPSTDN